MEFFVTEDRKVRITFLDKDHKAVTPPEGQAVSAIGGDRTNPTRMKFTVDGDSVISDLPLPEAKMVPIILQIKTAADADNVTEKFNVDFSDCPSCVHPEYACTCAH